MTDEALKKAFLSGLLGAVIAFVAIGGLIAAFATGHDIRPEGVAERWLTATSDLTRKGVRGEAEERVTNDGDLALAQGFLTSDFDYDGEAAFTALEVGHGRRVDDGTTAVPMKLTDRADDSVTRQAVLVLVRDGESWRVQSAQPTDDTLRVPSDGGEAVSTAPLGLYVAASAIAAGVALVCSLLVRIAGREHDAHVPPSTFAP